MTARRPSAVSSTGTLPLATTVMSMHRTGQASPWVPHGLAGVGWPTSWVLGQELQDRGVDQALLGEGPHDGVAVQQAVFPAGVWGAVSGDGPIAGIGDRQLDCADLGGDAEVCVAAGEDDAVIQAPFLDHGAGRPRRCP
jgi:hypothetical protein